MTYDIPYENTYIRIEPKEYLNCGLSPYIRSVEREFSLYNDNNESYIIDMQLSIDEDKDNILQNYIYDLLNEIDFHVENYLYSYDRFESFNKMNKVLKSKIDERFPTEDLFLLWLRAIKEGDNGIYQMSLADNILRDFNSSNSDNKDLQSFVDNMF